LPLIFRLTALTSAAKSNQKLVNPVSKYLECPLSVWLRSFFFGELKIARKYYQNEFIFRKLAKN
jgi:hypothetical protein